jgi:8-oxo-dGTP pyrophosphatase MutT (NUDIX family)
MKTADIEANREVRRQYGALPYRRSENGRIDIMLITSRDSGRWIIPKGWPQRGKSGVEVAACEAFEEAGLIGEPGSAPIGNYRYGKRESRGTILCRVEVFLLAVADELERWPEWHQRKRSWFMPQDAAPLVEEAGAQDSHPCSTRDRTCRPCRIAQLPRPEGAVKRQGAHAVRSCRMGTLDGSRSAILSGLCDGLKTTLNDIRGKMPNLDKILA